MSKSSFRSDGTNGELPTEIGDLIGDYEPFLEVSRRRKVQRYGHTTKRLGFREDISLIKKLE